MLRERANAQARQLAAYAAEHCALLERRFTTRRARVYLRLAEDPPEHPARPPCTLKTGGAWLRPIIRFPPTVRAKHGQVPDLSAVLLFREGVMGSEL